MSRSPEERFRRVSARVLEPGLSESDLEALAREWVEIKLEVLRMHGYPVPEDREGLVTQHLDRLKRLRRNLGVDA